MLSKLAYSLAFKFGITLHPFYNPDCLNPNIAYQLFDQQGANKKNVPLWAFTAPPPLELGFLHPTTINLSLMPPDQYRLAVLSVFSILQPLEPSERTPRALVMSYLISAII
jgi:hypothetical protein